KKKTVKQLKLRVGLIVFWYLKVSFFPDTSHYSTEFLAAVKICIVSKVLTNASSALRTSC
ncbi:hypothetical protein, partial [Lactobacillus sp. UMNPBX14]|uniref:hypothetical protein n=1 Tax=unclassified Lactobacillus TaxID=2620435 RepID=UPI003517F667